MSYQSRSPAYDLFCCLFLGRVDGLGKGFLGLFREVVLLIKLPSLSDSLLDEVPDHTEGGDASTDEVVLVIDLLNLAGCGVKGALELLDGVGVDLVSRLDLAEGILEAGLGLVKYLVFVIELGEVIVHLQRRLGHGRDDLTDLLISLGRVVGSGGTNGTKDRASDGEADGTTDDAGGELNGFFLDGDLQTNPVRFRLRSMRENLNSH